jgi:hypothetical protein
MPYDIVLDSLQVAMERSLWMYNLSRLDNSYREEVNKFIDAATRHAKRTKQKHIYCPCRDCKNVVVFDDTGSIIYHLLRRGFMEDYLIWTKHGEGSSAPYTTDNTAANAYVDDDRPEPDLYGNRHAMPDVNEPDGTADANEPHEPHGGNTSGVNDAVEDAEFLEALKNRFTEPSMFLLKGMEALQKAAQEPLYDESKGCTKEFSTLRSVLTFLTIKARYGWSDASFNEFLRVLGDLFPKRTQCLLTRTMQ